MSFADDYFAEECQVTRCVNRRRQQDETRTDLGRAQAMLRQITQRAKRGNSSDAADIYRALALFNLGELDPHLNIFPE